MDVFYEKRRTGRTIVLVTHDMGTVQSLCHRAMLLHDGKFQYLGSPEETALRYYRLNFADPKVLGVEAGKAPAELEPVHSLNARIAHAALLGSAGESVESVEQGEPISVDVVLEAARELSSPQFIFNVVSAEGTVVFGFTRALEARVAVGGRVRLSGTIDNPLVAGRYFLDCWIRQDEQDMEMGLQAARLLSFVVYGTAPRHGVVVVDTDVEARLD
jgi:hypothetical protein